MKTRLRNRITSFIAAVMILASAGSATVSADGRRVIDRRCSLTITNGVGYYEETIYYDDGSCETIHDRPSSSDKKSSDIVIKKSDSGKGSAGRQKYQSYLTANKGRTTPAYTQ